MTVTTEIEGPTRPTTDAPAYPGIAWARDFAIVGAVSAFLAPYLVLGSLISIDVLMVTAFAGALSGGALGYGLERVLRGPLETLPWPLMAMLLVGVGGLWGAFVGFAGGLAADFGRFGDFGGGDFGRGVSTVVIYFIACAAVAAAAQLAWFGPAYAHMRRRGGPTWPLVVAAAGTPVLGWAALLLLVG